MSYVIVSDSSSNVFSVPRANFCSVPLKIRVGEKEYVDGPDVDLEDMVEVLKVRHKEGALLTVSVRREDYT